MEEALLTQPSFKLNFAKQVQYVEWSPYEWSQQLICIGLGEEIIVGTIKFQVEIALFCQNRNILKPVLNWYLYEKVDQLYKTFKIFQEDDDVVEDLSYNPLRTFHHETRVHAIAWSPETSLNIVPKIVTFCVAGADLKIRLYNSDLSDKNTYEVKGLKKSY